MRIIPLLVLSVIFITGCKTTGENVEELFSLSSEHFKKSITVKDGNLDTIATLSTVEGIKNKRGLLGIVWDDNFIRAHIDKKTGSTRFVIYNTVYYRGAPWRHYSTVNYGTRKTGVKTARLKRINTDVDCANSRYQGCRYREDVVFEVERSMLDDIKGLYIPGEKRLFKYKLNGRTQDDYNFALLGAEIVGILDAVDEYIAKKGYDRLKGAQHENNIRRDRGLVTRESSVSNKNSVKLDDGRYNYQATEIANQNNCSSDEWPILLNKNGPIELYQVKCKQDDHAIAIECEWGKCRILK